ncbi:hypothetical protein PJWF_00024 [Achromobacter phage JWF]|uniref:tail protein n=1 Tax=Achromobacter phage JWF TaxID=1589748 RepID=UPI000588E6EE|nr:tail protein [Achromobacter phage JWF]AJD82918.1 hypothetical protein PJWF_00024 [Achromobacter phage JWF]
MWNPTVERCGLILRDGTILECQNTHEDPHIGFEISADDLVKYASQAVATWHTHPATSSNLSPDDYEAFLAWPQLRHYIISEKDVWCFFIRNNLVVLFDEENPSAWVLE